MGFGRGLGLGIDGRKYSADSGEPTMSYVLRSQKLNDVECSVRPA